MITHKGIKTLHTQRLVLRKFKQNDAVAMFENWASNEKVTRYLTWNPHISVEETRMLLDIWCKAYEKENTYNWAIEYNGSAIGSISVVRFSDKSEYAELGYCIGPSFWNMGLMTEAANAVIDYLFAEIGVNRIGISHAVNNPASGKVAQKCGLTYEGTKREYFKASTGVFYDISDYGILKSEWQKKK